MTFLPTCPRLVADKPAGMLRGNSGDLDHLDIVEMVRRIGDRSVKFPYIKVIRVTEMLQRIHANINWATTTKLTNTDSGVIKTCIFCHLHVTTSVL